MNRISPSDITASMLRELLAGVQVQLVGVVLVKTPVAESWTRSANATACGSWVASSTAVPRSRQRLRISQRTSLLRRVSRFPVGSSASTSLGFIDSACAIITRWRSPIESLFVGCFIRSPSPSSTSSGSIRRVALRGSVRSSFRAAFSRASAAGISSLGCPTMPSTRSR